MPMPGLQAGGDIRPHRFVKLSATADNTVLVAGNNDRVIGISQRGTRNTPYGSLDDGFAAKAGENLQVYGLGEEAILELGGTVTRGSLLCSDANGRGVEITSDGDEVGAVALQSGTSGTLVAVYILNRQA